MTGTLAGESISIQNYGAVTLSGTLTAANVAITATSTQNAEAGTPYNNNGTITQSSGSITAGTITLTDGDAFRQTGGSLTGTGTNGQITISAQGALTLGGAVSAPAVILSAVTRSYPNDYGELTQVNPGIITQTGGQHHRRGERTFRYDCGADGPAVTPSRASQVSRARAGSPWPQANRWRSAVPFLTEPRSCSTRRVG